MLTRVLSYHQVSAEYLEFLFAFGQQTDPVDLSFSGFRAHVSPATVSVPVGADVEALGRSGKQLQLCYNLKTIEIKSAPDTDVSKQDWSIRHVAVYHQLDLKTGKTLWILTRGGLDIRDAVQRLTDNQADPKNRTFDSVESSFQASFAPHILCSHWAVENWRWYLRWREEIFTNTVSLHIELQANLSP